MQRRGGQAGEIVRHQHRRIRTARVAPAQLFHPPVQGIRRAGGEIPVLKADIQPGGAHSTLRRGRYASRTSIRVSIAIGSGVWRMWMRWFLPGQTISGSPTAAWVTVSPAAVTV